MKEILTKVSVWIRKYAFSRQYGKIAAFIVLAIMVVLFIYGSERSFNDIDKLTNGFALSFGFAIIIYALLYALAYEIILAIVVISAYSIAYFLDSYPNAQDIINAIGSLAIFVIFIKWASKIRNPNKTVHPDSE